jgi:glucose-6-phosphate 1-dehydrogenase
MTNVYLLFWGGAGDLSKRKLIPALYKLLEDGKIKTCSLLCVSIDDTDIDAIFDQAYDFIPHVQDHIFDKLKKRSSYFRMDFHEDAAYGQLKEVINNVEQQDSLVGNRLFYFATMPEHFDVLTKNLAAYEIAQPMSDVESKGVSTWSRLVYEKPFGNDLASAEQINACIKKAFHEDQIFRIDHYLGKELVGNIALVRFTNRILEPLWNQEHIESVQIILNENIGIEGRGGFYDSYGALKDMVQSHMLQILALVAMEPPAFLKADYIRDAKAEVLNKVHVASVMSCLDRIPLKHMRFYSKMLLRTIIQHLFGQMKLNIPGISLKKH